MALRNGCAFSRIYGSQSTRIRVQNWPTERINLQRAGIHLIVYQKGKLGRFDLGALVLVFITGVAS